MQRPSSPEIFGFFLSIWFFASLAIWYELPEDIVPWMMKGAMIGVLGAIVTMLFWLSNLRTDAHQF